jgi:HK97 family phage major capsid protein
MASKLAELREERAVLARRAQDLNAQYGDNQRMPQADADKLDAMLAHIEKIDAEIETLGLRAEAAGAEIGERVSGGMRTAKEFRTHYMRNGAPRKEERVGLADFMRGIADMSTTHAVRNALSEGTDTAGGYLVPTFVMPQILEALVPMSSVLTAGASIVPLDMGAKTFTQAAIDNIPTAAWRAESGSVAQSDPTFRAVVAAPKSLAFYFKVSRELLADGANLETALTTVIAQAFAKELDRAALRGTGTAPEPRGVLNTVGVGAVGNGANGAALAGYTNFFTALQTILSVDGPMPTAAIMSPRSLVKLGGLLDTTNQPLVPPPLLQKMQMLATSQVPNNLTVGTSTDCSEIYIGDFSRVRFAMRERVSIQKLGELFATTGEIGFLGHVRADVMVEYPKAFAVVTGVRP